MRVTADDLRHAMEEASEPPHGAAMRVTADRHAMEFVGKRPSSNRDGYIARLHPMVNGRPQQCPNVPRVRSDSSEIPGGHVGSALKKMSGASEGGLLTRRRREPEEHETLALQALIPRIPIAIEQAGCKPDVKLWGVSLAAEADRGSDAARCEG